MRVRRDDLLTLQVDGTHGSAVAGLRNCVAQHAGGDPALPVESGRRQPDQVFRRLDRTCRTRTASDNAFKVQWELFLRHVVKGDPFPWTLLEGAKGVQLAELGLQSWAERRWVDVPPLRLTID